MLEIRCPHCEQAVTMQVNVLSKEPYRKGPPSNDPGIEIDNFIIEKIESKMSLGKIAKLLMDKGVRTPRGYTKWHNASVKRSYEQALNRRELHKSKLNKETPI